MDYIPFSHYLPNCYAEKGLQEKWASISASVSSQCLWRCPVEAKKDLEQKVKGDEPH